MHKRKASKTFCFLSSRKKKEYGGQLKSLESFHEEQKERLEKEYREWLIDSSNLKQLPKEKKTDKKTALDANANAYDPPMASLNKLSLD